MDKESLDLDISPDMGMYRILPQQSYDYSFALAEFIDNSIQAFENSNLNALEIKVDIFTSEYMNGSRLRNRIIISDDGPGMSSEKLIGAFKPANKTQVHGLNEFGIGMKAAAIFFSDHWSMSTKAEDGEEYFIDFDLEKLLLEGNDHVTAKLSEQGSIDTKGTTITLHNIRKSIDKPKAFEVRQRLAEIYRKFTDRDERPITIKVSINGQAYEDLRCRILDDNTVLVSPKSLLSTVGGAKKYYLIGEEQRWYKDIEFEVTLNGKLYPVKGFIYQLKTGNVADNPGISVFRYNRLIVGLTNEKDQFKPRSIFGAPNKHKAQRLYCELYIDGMPVSYTKDRLDFDDDCLIEGILNSDGVKDLIDNAQHYRPDEENIIYVNDESELPSARGSQTSKPSAKEKKSKSNTSDKKTKPRIKSDMDLAKQVVRNLQRASLLSLGLRQFIKELIHQLIAERPIAAAVCLRVILEQGLLKRIELSFPQHFDRVDGKSIQALVNYINSHPNDFFPNQKPRLAYEVIKANSKSMQYGDVLLLNNVSHGNYNPDLEIVIKAIGNLEPLLNWVYEV